MDAQMAPAGWYTQPDGTQRFWTGGYWSDQVRAQPQAPAPIQGQAVVPATPQPNASLTQSQLAYTPAGYVAVSHVAPKSPGLALLGSFFLPGLGQLINGQVAKGLITLVAFILSWLLVIALIGFLLLPAIWIWSMVDAYTGAQRWNAQHGIMS